MGKKISINYRFRKSNKEVATFTESFLQDISRCFSRFKVDITFSDAPVSKEDEITLILMSASDLDDRQFIDDVLKLSNNPGAVLINLNPIKVDKSFPLHKFKIYSFWDQIKETGEIRLFRRGASEFNAFYWEKITDITIEILEKYSDVKESKKGKIYIAQTDNSQSSDRDNLSRDLIEMGYDVYPSRLLSLDYTECTEQIKQQLKGCSLIIQPVHLMYTKYFSEKEISIVEYQCNLSSSYAENNQHNVRRIIWIPSDFEITDEENQIFVEKILRDQNQTQNTLVLKVTLEELKKIYRKLLSGQSVQVEEKNLPDVYVVADKDDEKVSEKFMKSDNSGMAIKTNFKGITYNEHLKFLANSQVVVINYSNENKQWLTMKVNDIFKSKGINSSKPFKKLILVKENKDLDTSAFEGRFSEVHVCSLDELKLNLAVRNN